MSPKSTPTSLLFCFLAVVSQVQAEQTLIKVDHHFNLSAVETRDVKLSRNSAALRIDAGHKIDWPGITLKAPGGHWNLSAFQRVAMDVKNLGKNAVTVHCRVDNPGSDGTKHCVTHSIVLPPGGQRTLQASLARQMPEQLKKKLFGMRGFPGGMVAEGGMDPAEVTQLVIFVSKPKEDHHFEISNLRADGDAGDPLVFEEDKFFPLIDGFGQYRHKDWPGKVKSVDEFATRKVAEAADLADHPGSEEWDSYGGWKAGPQLAATGFFRTEKSAGKWWLVDPDGRLFWSHGIDCVQCSSASTPITDRKHWFAELPNPDSPFAAFYGRGNWGPHNYYDGMQYETYDFSAANLLRKYGKDYREQFNLLTHRRLRSWGLNTIGNWSDGAICRMRQTPYTATIGIASKTLGGSVGYWRKFVDVFSPDFRAAARQSMATHKNGAAGDRWCIGFFSGNEESWGDDLSLAIATLQSPADQPAKKVFVADLRRKYETIERLNVAWSGKYASWDALLQSTDAPNVEKARDDLAAFYTKTAERYFEVCRDCVKEIAPNQLYLGCRFSDVNDRVVRAAAKFCDVLSFNRYEHCVIPKQFAGAIDKPIVIGEFHFGALDRGMFHTGLVFTANQADRAAAYKTYVRSALASPLVVGTHWFQFGDQATTGRGDGENYQIGFLDVCDTPYPETIQASREVARNLYQFRTSHSGIERD